MRCHGISIFTHVLLVLPDSGVPESKKSRSLGSKGTCSPSHGTTYSRISSLFPIPESDHRPTGFQFTHSEDVASSHSSHGRCRDAHLDIMQTFDSTVSFTFDWNKGGCLCIIRIFCIACGFGITKADIFPPVAASGAGQIVLSITLPCLMFSKIIPAFTAQNAGALGGLLFTDKTEHD